MSAQRHIKAQRMAYFTMVLIGDKWVRCGQAYATKEAARSWLLFVKRARRASRAKVASMPIAYDADGKLTAETKDRLDKEFNMTTEGM